MQELFTKFTNRELLQEDRDKLLNYLPDLDIQTILADSDSKSLIKILADINVELYSSNCKSKLILDYLDIRDTLIENHKFIISGYLELLKRYNLEPDGKNNAYLFIFMYLLSKKLNDHIFCQYILHKSIMLTNIENYQDEYNKHCRTMPNWEFRNGLFHETECIEDIVTWNSINDIEFTDFVKVSKQCYISQANSKYVVPENTVLLSKYSPFIVSIRFM